MGWVETDERKGMGYSVQKEVGEKCVILRWMDDLVLLVEEGLSREARRWVRRRKGRWVYGRELEMVQTNGVEAFGFQWRTKKNGDVNVWADEKWTNKLDKVYGFKPQSSLFPGWDLLNVGCRKGY